MSPVYLQYVCSDYVTMHVYYYYFFCASTRFYIRVQVCTFVCSFVLPVRTHWHRAGATKPATEGLS